MTSARDYIADLAAAGQYHFTSDDIRKSLGITQAAAKLALLRLARHGLVASPARGFHVIVPPEYRRLGCLPAEQFIPALMAWKQLPYYAGLLSAAQFHGAAHHRPQEFQVIVAKNRRPIECGVVRVGFIARKRVEDVPVQDFNTPRGTIRVSTIEATAIDLVGYEHRAGGLDQVATVLSELSEQLDPDKLVAAAKTAPISWAQRLGFLLEEVGATAALARLESYVHDHARLSTPLAVGVSHAGARQAKDWKLYINAQVEAET